MLMTALLFLVTVVGLVKIYRNLRGDLKGKYRGNFGVNFNVIIGERYIWTNGRCGYPR